MMDRKDGCRACQEELAFAGGETPFTSEHADHVTGCTTCQSFERSVKELARLARLDRSNPPSDLVERAMEQLRPELARRVGERSRLRARLALAGLASLPIVVGLNGLLVWTVYASLQMWLSQPLAAIAAYVVGASALLGLSLTYGSLPLMAEWGLQLRQRYHDLVTRAAAPYGLEATAIGRFK